jgi:preprotein translocase subunit SecD
MSSDYISRLRAELLRAGAVGRARRRRARAVRRLRPLAAAAAVGLLVATVVLTLPDARRDEIPAQGSGEAVALTYRVQTGGATQAAQILRERLNAAGITAEVTAGDRTLTITAPDAARADVTGLTAPGRLAIYDWERSVLGPDGRPAPIDPAVTGGQDAGRAAALTEAEARSRADTSPGARAVQADRGWFALAGDPALTNADVASARADEDPAGGGASVALDLTPPGQQAFTTLTRELAQRGAELARSGDPLRTSQHLALVLDDRIVSTPFINWREVPDGIDGADGAYMSGLPTPEQARLTAALLSAGPLPGTLQLVRG